ncbi:hypothetical protein ROZALSC1DRAFT_26998 [Rozella allomycis CSF55]|uniref:Uncharacterized protein n=1 Tax=Rozella allomycis (strain CSF55) TaxID=988480 RepID=A0A075AQV7_ROZAC|nr:hypothetical protein O9G_003789 [Rozella allomycis CSF55]RKP21600.1 hypothetical protein ROZALSC1DRAFT_26998 [Rozella allomycis CSF55]|eukprot:EPZ32661.1 hypothetical protein O9G_003789 [Rozella allomycis CSF55]
MNPQNNVTYHSYPKYNTATEQNGNLYNRQAGTVPNLPVTYTDYVYPTHAKAKKEKKEDNTCLGILAGALCFICIAGTAAIGGKK